MIYLFSKDIVLESKTKKSNKIYNTAQKLAKFKEDTYNKIDDILANPYNTSIFYKELNEIREERGLKAHPNKSIEDPIIETRGAWIQNNEEFSLS